MEIEIWACCYSEKSDTSISFGTSVETVDGSFDATDTEWIYVGMSESFWENHWEFEAGIEQATILQREDKALTSRQALFNVFGHFELAYQIDGEEVDLNIDFDADSLMYALLET